jgi:hypothetical protein
MSLTQTTVPALSATAPETRFRCRHIFTDGRRCQSPCLRREEFCYFHHTTRQPVGPPELAARKARRAEFQMPIPEDRSAIQFAIGEVLQRIAANQLDPRRAGLLLYGLQIASLNLPRPQPAASRAEAEAALETVEEIVVDSELGTLAPPHVLLRTCPRQAARHIRGARRVHRPHRRHPVFGLDALSSAAYGPEAALTLLIPLGLAGIALHRPHQLAIIGLLAIVYFSYCQTIDAYPHGGGSYTVASENLGATAGLFAAAALMIDYILNAAVGISAGVGALVSAFPALQPHTLALCLLILACSRW